jgi:glucose/arabinose dehydrogenase
MIIPLVFLALQGEADYYSVENFSPPSGEVIEVGDLDFDSTGVLYLCTRRGRVWRIENALADDPAEARWTMWAEGLHSGLGLKVVNDEVYVVQRGELSRLRDTDGDGRAETIDTITQDWGMSGNYHEFAFGLPVDEQGNFYITTNVGFWSPEWWHGLSKAPYRGWVLRVTADGEVEPIANGVRSPCGLGMNSEGDLFYTDNQGDWMPACGVFHVEEGDFFSHPASLRWTDAYGNGGQVPSSTEPPDALRKPAAIWIPYEWSRSTGNLVAVEENGNFGPFDGQMVAAELTNGMIVRLQMEKVRGQWQGACFPLRQEIGSATRVRFAADGSLFVGYTNRGWGGRAPGDGLARIRWTGKTPLEMKTVHLVQDGFEIELTEPLPAGVVPFPGAISLREYDYNWWWDYGSPEMRERMVEVTSVAVSANRRILYVHTSGLVAGKCVRGRIIGLGLLHDTFDYTINQLPEGPLAVEQVSKKVEPPAPRANENEGWLTLTWGDALGMWEGEAWELCAIRPDPNNHGAFVSTIGNSAIANINGRSDLRTSSEFGDIEFRFDVMLPAGGDSGLYFMDRYELQLVDDWNECAGIYSVKNPRAKVWRGPHDWHTISGKFFAPQFSTDGTRVRKASFADIEIDGVMVIGAAECDQPTDGGLPGEVARGPLRFQGTMTDVAIADVRVRPLYAPVNLDGWNHLEAPFEDLVVDGDFELHARIKIGEGEVGIDFGETSVRINAIGASSARTGSMLPGTTIRTDLLQADTWFDLDIQRVGITLSVALNDVVVNRQELASSSGPVRFAPEEGAEIELDDLAWRVLP